MIRWIKLARRQRKLEINRKRRRKGTHKGTKTRMGERTPRAVANDETETPLRRSTRARKAVTKFGGVMIRRIQENEDAE